MARQARGEYLDPQSIQIVHAISRCVRRAFLCGDDPYSGKSYEHRRQWIRDRLEFLASVFAIDCLTYSLMSNHIHLILRSRPDVVRTWSDEEVARRWLRLCPKRKHADRSPAEPNEFEINSITSDLRKVAELRIRLSDISWWMAKTAEKIAKMANREDQCTGRFWEGRYRAQLILDEASLLACAIYVDLNPIRAALAETPETSQFTGAHDRIEDLQLRQSTTSKCKRSGNSSSNRNLRRSKKPNSRVSSPRTREWERSRRRKRSGWMSPLEIDERSDPIGPNSSRCGRRASLKGFLSVSLCRYLELLDWTGRQLRTNKRGSIPCHLAPILKRLGIDGGAWFKLTSHFGKLFKRAAGTTDSISVESQRRRQSWMQAPGASCLS